MRRMSKQPRKPLKWIGSAKRDLDAMMDLRSALLSEEILERYQDTQGRSGIDQRAAESCKAGLRDLASTARRMMMSKRNEVTIEEGSTNVYADFGYADAAEMQRKSRLAGEIARARSKRAA